jgi:hypothetical protein
MIDKLISILFKWTGFREALFAEVNMYNSLTKIISDPESMKIASAFWDEGDGWRGWSIKGDKYYFNDVPEHDLMSVMESLEEMANGRS